jgi:hypothetical protein
MSATASRADVERMLKRCAAGYTMRRTTHGYSIKFNGRTYPSMPKFDNIELGHIRKMVRHLQINRDCARQTIPI